MTSNPEAARKSSLDRLVASTVPLSLHEFQSEMSYKSSSSLFSPDGNDSPRSLDDIHQAANRGSSNNPHDVIRLLRNVSKEPLDHQPQLRARDDGDTGKKTTRPLSSDSDCASLSNVFKQLDEQEETRRRYTLQMDAYSQMVQSVSWEEGAEDSCHLWHPRETREACYLSETQFCQDQKTVYPKRSKVRCSACKMLVHVTCMKQLRYEGVLCKTTYREVKQKAKNTSLYHHFLKRRKLSGRCAGGCGRGFTNFKNLSGKTFEGFSCSWCGDSYHNGCLTDKLRNEVCHLGPLRNLIIPSSWIIKLPHIEPEPSPVDSSSSGLFANRRKKTSRRRTRRNTSMGEERASKYFTVKALTSTANKPTIVFINPKSGGNQGARLMQTFHWLLNPRQVFDLSQGGPKFGLQLFRHCPNLRVLACGGDGTVGWVLSMLDQLNIKPLPPVAVLPLGTGNDLSRVLNWGGAYADEPLEKILMHIEDGPVTEMDRWMISVWPNPDVTNYEDSDGKNDVPLHVVNNYFSIGADAQVSLEFHESREANPQKFNNRFKNKFFYSRLAGQDLLQRKFATLTDNIRIIGDGYDMTSMIRQLRLEAICFLNIPSYGSGNNPWGSPPPGATNGQFKIGPQSMEDGMIEIVGFWASTFPKLLMGAHGERLAQCQHVKIYTSASLPVQIDGEACKLKPSVIEIVLQNKALMVHKRPLRAQQTPLRGLNESQQLKISVSKVTAAQYDEYHSNLREIKTAAVGLGLVVTTPGQTLRSLRPQIERFTKEPAYTKQYLSSNWQYLDIASTSRLDKVFKILPEQEEAITISDLLFDGILVIECETPPTSPPIIVEEMSTLDQPNLVRRNMSYDEAMFSEPPQGSSGLMRPLEEDKEGSLSSSPHSPNASIGHEVDVDVCLLPGIIDDSPEEECEQVWSYKKIQKALFDAVKRGNLKKIEQLHKQGARLANVDEYGLSPLHHSARLGRKEVVQYIVKNIPKEALDLQDEDKAQTALHKAAWYGYTGICRILVEAGASLTRTDYQGNTPYYKSIESEDLELQKYLLKKQEERGYDCELEEVAV